jgi:hypothetical protein
MPDYLAGVLLGVVIVPRFSLPLGSEWQASNTTKVVSTAQCWLGRLQVSQCMPVQND